MIFQYSERGNWAKCQSVECLKLLFLRLIVANSSNTVLKDAIIHWNSWIWMKIYLLRLKNMFAQSLALKFGVLTHHANVDNLKITRHFCISCTKFYMEEVFSRNSTYQRKNFEKRFIFCDEIPIFNFYGHFLEMPFRGFLRTLATISQDWKGLWTWNFQELFHLSFALEWMRYFFGNQLNLLLIPKSTFFRFQTPWKKISKNFFIHSRPFQNRNKHKKKFLQ